MDADPRADIVSGQYERWVYPEPIEDLPSWLTNNWQWFDPSHAHRMFWPNRTYQPNMDILVAGCGTNQAAVIAYTNPGSRVVAVDVSQPSLDHHRHLKEKYGMENLELHLLPIEEIGSLHQNFDLIISTGVLHHLAEPEVGMRALASCLRTDGVMALMLYAHYGRIGVEIMQALFRELGFQQDQVSVNLVTEALASLPAEHPVKSYLTSAPDLAFDAGLVDTFLHGRDRSYTVHDCLELVDSAGMVFQEWFFKSPYEPPSDSGNNFLQLVASMPDAQRWSTMERINSRNACHFFTVCHANRPPSTYQFDIDTDEAMELIPMFRYRCGIEGGYAVRPGWNMPLSAVQQTMLSAVDGNRSLKEIVAVSALNNNDFGQDGKTQESLARAFFQFLSRRDFITFAHRP